jgi:triphosphoribosyl-dephospho-CoA synthase
MNSSHFAEIDLLSVALVRGARMELYLTPKPGLVDLADCGSHPDLSLSRMEQSLHFLPDYLRELQYSLAAGEPFTSQVAIGMRSEIKMLTVLGTNTHKGYLFLSGLLLVARWREPSDDGRRFRGTIASLAGEFFDRQLELATNGRQARVRYGAWGIIREAKSGFPALFDEALPAYREAVVRHGSFMTASFAMLARLMQTVEDTTTLHRCGAQGLARIRRDGRQIERIIASGGDCVPFLQATNREYIRMNLTMGGVADMLGLSYGCLIASGAIRGDSLQTALPRVRLRDMAPRAAKPTTVFPEDGSSQSLPCDLFEQMQALT